MGVQTPLKKIIQDIQSGTSVRGLDRPASSNETGVLKVSAVTSGCFKHSENKTVTDPTQISRLKCWPVAGDILLARSNGSLDLVGSCVLVHETHPNLFLSDKHWRLVIQDPNRDHPQWLYQTLNEPGTRAKVIALSLIHI